MSFNHLGYDACAYAKTLQESTDPLEYNLFLAKYESCYNCSIGSFTNNLEFGIKTDVDSDLKGVTRIGSKCPSYKYPANSQQGTSYTTPLTCQGPYYLTPSYLPPVTSSGLKDLNSYGQNMCPVMQTQHP